MARGLTDKQRAVLEAIQEYWSEYGVPPALITAILGVETRYGRHRGGYGLVRDYQMLTEGAVVHCSYGRTQTRPWGLDGGGAGSVNALIHRPAGDCVPASYSRIGHLPTRQGDVVRIVTGGGGGWGPPQERDPEAVAREVREGLLTRAEAREIYGFEVEPAQ